MSEQLTQGQRKRAQALYETIAGDGDAQEGVCFDYIAAEDRCVALEASVVSLRFELQASEANRVKGNEELVAQRDAALAKLAKWESWQPTDTDLAEAKQQYGDGTSKAATTIYIGVLEAKYRESKAKLKETEAQAKIGPPAYEYDPVKGTYKICLGCHPETDEYEWIETVPVENLFAEEHGPCRERIAALGRDLAAQHELVLCLGRSCDEIKSARNSLEQQLASAQAKLAEAERALETERMRLAACGVAALANTPTSAKERIGRDNLYWSGSYGDVCNAVDREMALRATLKVVAETARRLLDRIDINEGLGEYRGGPAFVVKDMMAALSLPLVAEVVKERGA